MYPIVNDWENYGISIHSLRMEGDLFLVLHQVRRYYFNPLPPHGGRLILPLTPCNAFCISIHSLRMEGDTTRKTMASLNRSFQSTPSAWRETTSSCWSPVPQKFQSTPSAWRETPAAHHCCRWRTDFNPLPPHGGRRNAPSLTTQPGGISIHSLRMEGDCVPRRPSGGQKFQSTPSAWRETFFQVPNC